MPKIKVEDILDTLKPKLRQRIDRVVDHLRAAPNLPDNAICYRPGVHGDIVKPAEEWGGPNRSELDQVRIDAYRWSVCQLQANFDQPISVFEALSRIEDNVSKLVNTAVDALRLCVKGLVEKELQAAVLSRDQLVKEWPWPLTAMNGGALVHLLLVLCSELPPNEQLISAWPPYAASAMVGKWARLWLRKNAQPPHNESVAIRLQEMIRSTPEVFAMRPGLPVTQMATSALALLYTLECEVKENQQRKFIAIDTCREHTKLIESWRDTPKTREPAQWAYLKNQRLELILPDEAKKCPIQLSLALEGEGIAVEVARVVREWRSWAGLRHWVTFQSLITQNKRLGWTRWTVDQHLQAMEYSKNRIRRLENRRAAAEMVELFTKIEIAVYDDKGKLRERRPLVMKGNTYEKLVGSDWEIEGLELKVNPFLYRGVRDPKTGELGRNWWPAPKALAHIDHDKFGPAIAFGAVLAARWRMELSRSGRTYVELTGKSLLRAAGLPYRQRNVISTWRSVKRNLAELQERGGIERWEWQGEPDLGTVCRLYAPIWAVDRVVHGVPPKEIAPTPDALTGSELKAWRRERDLTQVQASGVLGIGLRTIKRAEKQASKPLSRRLRAALERCQFTSR